MPNREFTRLRTVQYSDLVVPSNSRRHFSLRMLLVVVTVAGPISIFCSRLPLNFYLVIGAQLLTIATIMLSAWWISYLRAAHVAVIFSLVCITAVCLAIGCTNVAFVKAAHWIKLGLATCVFVAIVTFLGWLLSLSRYAN